MCTSVWFYLTMSCVNPDQPHSEQNDATSGEAPGWVIAIGGGRRTDTLMFHIIRYCRLQPGDTVWIAPMASEEPDSAYWYVALDFQRMGLIPKPYVFYTLQDYYPPDTARVKLVFFTGGDQNRLMQSLSLANVLDDLKLYRLSGGHIAGTSAGAAVMSEYMITGNQWKHPDYEATFSRLIADNVEIVSGAGLLSSCIIDQHFITRSRYNRLISALFELPMLSGIGVEESSAIVTDDSIAVAIGSGQIVQIRAGTPKRRDDLIGFEDLIMHIHLPGDTFYLK
ncbi:MAG: cyanophycinase [Thermaurantimonas sp.]